ncbi:hypothetical protein CYMTET_11135 [Cymbomonas tetramitiformis]|uniref:Uncharacterized protein n=1 Tax=Cymbomonas tetramitiformis TaxID=36881 RepID=A0AAE0LD46_9CHLO|nr:hypothetical protein CYMTET_42182 [Cymbomonas tetramitiformis]KAK3281056.1 hypothetical protein CYMTET_11135 [Cymbomonas tetramitiformis]|eukprot:gene22879-27651_t
MNNNSSDKRALSAGCRGVFSVGSFITIGEANKPLVYGQRAKDRSCYGGKQLLTNPPKAGHGPDVYFDAFTEKGKKWSWISDGDNFEDRLMYMKQQKEKRSGFNSADYKRRDEFTSSIRTEQYREQLQQESKFRKAALKGLSERPDVLALDESALKKTLSHPSHTTSSKPYLYDLVYENDEANSSASKCARDTKNPTLLGLDRKHGTYKTSSMGYGYGIGEVDHEKPMFARSPIVRSTFYRPRTIPFNNKP